MNIVKVAAFSHQGKGGNPAGVAFCDEMPGDGEMLKIAGEVGYSETAFLVKQPDGWRGRYFAPAMEFLLRACHDRAELPWANAWRWGVQTNFEPE